MELLVSYAAALVLFAIIDLTWIKFVTGPVFSQTLGDMMLDDPRPLPAIAFFVVYQAGLLYLAVLPAIAAGSWIAAATNGALLGLIAYGTYEATNLATLKRWTVRMAVLDVVWGVLSSAVCAVAAYLVYFSIL